MMLTHTHTHFRVAIGKAKKTVKSHTKTHTNTQTRKHTSTQSHNHRRKAKDNHAAFATVKLVAKVVNELPIAWLFFAASCFVGVMTVWLAYNLFFVLRDFCVVR